MKSRNVYTSNITSISEHKVLRLQLKGSQTWFSLIPTYGGALNEYVVNGKPICLGVLSEKEMQSQTEQAYSGAQLFPYPNRVNNATYHYNGQSYGLPKNDTPLPHALHGLVYNQSFTVESIDHKNGVIKTNYRYKKNHPGFPFEAHIENTFKLQHDALTITTCVENIGQQEFPLGHGWHPYFKVDDIVDDCSLQIFGNEHFPVNENLIPYGSVETIEDFLELKNIGTKNLNHCFKLKTDKDIKAILKTHTYNVIMELKGYDYLQIYTPPDRKNIAIEPQTCAPNAFNNQIGLLYLKPKKKIELKFKIKICT